MRPPREHVGDSYFTQTSPALVSVGANLAQPFGVCETEAPP